LVNGTQRTRLTRKQASAVCKVSLPLIHEAENGGTKKPELQGWWQRASFADRVNLIRCCGIAEVWDALATAVA
jgi:hypothetical protein